MNKSHSSYLQYLPPVLWVENGINLDFFNRFLLIFEKILTGIDDDAILSHADHTHIDFEAAIDNLYTLYNPWKTKLDSLPYLASWVALQLEPSWEEYQKRKLIGEIVSVYQLRGLKQGLHKYFEIYKISNAKPRVVIDDGDTIFRIVLNNDLVEKTNIVQSLANGNPLLHPMRLDIEDSGNYIITDQGDEGLAPPAGPGPIPATLWKFTPKGDPGFTNDPIPALKAIHKGPPLFTPTGIVVESTGAYVVVDIGPDAPPSGPPLSGIYRFSPPGYSPPIPIADNNPTTPAPSFAAINPVDMVRFADGHFIILDRGARLPNPASPRIIVVQEWPSLTIDTYLLNSISEPTSIALDNSGKFIVTDAGIGPPTPAQPTGTLLKADIFIVDISTTPVSETSLLGTLSSNPLIYPTAVVLEDINHIIVSDLGVKPPGRHARLAEPAALYRIPLPPTAARVDLISRDPNFVWPSDIAVDSNGAIIMLDHGESQDQAPARSWRSLIHEFGVIIYFSEDRIITPEEKRRIIGSISRIVDREKPAHSYWTLKTQ
ncbi:MAG TPA: phage tail protein [candidate division Zixibacteria bacterium]|nr:phage tail protein [candidate division Zixibacteria bacterium]